MHLYPLKQFLLVTSLVQAMFDIAGSGIDTHKYYLTTDAVET